MSGRPEHYSYTFYADPDNASRFDERRFGGPIGELVAREQARVLTLFAGSIAERTVLDVGTGTGRAALLLAEAGAKVTGVDASEQMLAVARARASRAEAPITFARHDAHDLQFADRAFDTVVCLRVLMHTPDWRRCVSELCRVSDRLVIIDYPSMSSAALIQSWLRRIASRLGAHNEPYRVLFDRDVSAAITSAGFRVTSIHKQFVLPIAIHKAVGSPRFTQATEAALRSLKLVSLFGSPVTLRAERA